MIHTFNAPTKASSVVIYALEEVRLLCMVIRCLEQNRCTRESSQSTTRSAGDFVLKLTAEQFSAFQGLLDQLQLSHLPPSQLHEYIHQALSTVYMPNNLFEMFKDRFLNPADIYLCLRCVHHEGGFQAPKLLTNFHVKTQFGIRLFLLDHIDRLYEEFKLKTSTDQYELWMK
jgi:hypothetical protein